MVFTREQLQTVVAELLPLVGAENQARASELLTDVQNGFSEIFTASETATATAAQLTTANEELRAANMKLFRQVGTIPGGNPAPVPNAPEPAPEPAPTPISYDSLFDENGGLK